MENLSSCYIGGNPSFVFLDILRLLEHKGLEPRAFSEGQIISYGEDNEELYLKSFWDLKDGEDKMGGPYSVSIDCPNAYILDYLVNYLKEFYFVWLKQKYGQHESSYNYFLYE